MEKKKAVTASVDPDSEEFKAWVNSQPPPPMAPSAQQPGTPGDHDKEDTSPEPVTSEREQ